MTTFLYFILLYALVIGILFVVYKLLSLGIDKYFRMHKARALSPTYPIIKAFSVLLIAFLARNSIANQLMPLILEFLKKTGLKISTPDLTNSVWGTIETIFFYLAVTTIAVVYAVISYKNQINRAAENGLLKQEPPKIKFPPLPPPPSPIFYERVKELFELKFQKENLSLDYDGKEKLLYGSYQQGFNRYTKVIYCEDSVSGKSVSHEMQRSIFKRINDIIKKYKIVSSDEEIVEIYYLLEKGDFETSDLKMHCKTEEQFLDELIDFSNYLKKLVYKFETEKLPFSSRDREEDKLTLKETFIHPKFYLNNNLEDTKEHLEKYIDQWLGQDNDKHLVLLGDYGMGKTSFAKYYAAKLAIDILNGERVKRFPVFISLTNASPRFGGIENLIGLFLTKNVGVKQDTFDKLVNSGKVVFILDGFDEMGYIGTHDQRIKQFNAIWQLATKRNKILITGRPTYFPNDEDLVHAFNILDAEEQKVPQDNPYFERIELKEFGIEEINASIKAYRYPAADVKKYVNFIENNSSIYDLCKRPVLMHMVREMLPLLSKDYKTEDINAGILMGHYINHWITRQIDKKIVSAVEDRKVKKEFVMDFFVELAAQFYQKEIETLPADDIIPALKEKICRLELKDKNEIEGFETEILSGYFVEIDNDEYKFVHKSFKEYFVAQQILKLMGKKGFKHPLMTKKNLSREIIDFVYDSDKFDKTKANYGKVPLLLQLTDNQFMIWLKTKIFRIYANIFFLDTKLFSSHNIFGEEATFMGRALKVCWLWLLFSLLNAFIVRIFRLDLFFNAIPIYIYLMIIILISSIRLRFFFFVFFTTPFSFYILINIINQEKTLVDEKTFTILRMFKIQDFIIFILEILVILTIILLIKNRFFISKAYYIGIIKGQLDKNENKRIVYLLKKGFDYSDLELADEKTSSPEYQEDLAGT